jgi:hypothetical protein
LFWLRHRSGGLGWRDVAWFVAVFVVYLGYRAFVGSVGPATRPTYDIFYYILNNFWVPWLLPGLWALLVQLVLAEFGPLLVLAFAGWRADEPGSGGRIGGMLYLGCMLVIEVFAYDVMRFAAFLFLPVVLGGLAVLRLPRGRWLLGLLLVAAVVGYTREHPVPSQQGGATFTRIEGEMRSLVFPRVPVDPQTQQVGRYRLDDAVEVLGRSFRQQAPTWALVAGAWLGCGLLGVWLGRRVVARGASGLG